MRNRRILIIILALFAVILSVVLVTRSQNQPPIGPTGLEKGSATSTVGINGAERLNEILLSQEFAAISQALSDYIRTHVSRQAISADIVPGSTVVNKDGSINFSVKIENPNTTFDALITRPDSNHLTFKVPKSNYSITVAPYL